MLDSIFNYIKVLVSTRFVVPYKMHFFNNFSNFINLFVDVVTFVMTFEMIVWLMFFYDRATKMIALVSLFVLNSNVATKIAAIIEVK